MNEIELTITELGDLLLTEGVVEVGGYKGFLQEISCHGHGIFMMRVDEVSTKLQRRFFVKLKK